LKTTKQQASVKDEENAAATSKLVHGQPRWSSCEEENGQQWQQQRQHGIGSSNPAAKAATRRGQPWTTTWSTSKLVHGCVRLVI